MKTPRPRQRRNTGISLIEVLITLVILLLGLLGLAGTMMHSQRSETESYQRVQALGLLQDMVARINTNRQVASCYAFTNDAVAGTPFLGTATELDPACGAGASPAQQALAEQDLREWSELLKGGAEVSSAGADVGAMIGGRGCVTFDPFTEVYLVSVAWQGIGKTAAPHATWACASGEYGEDDAFRRVVSVTLRISNL